MRGPNAVCAWIEEPRRGRLAHAGAVRSGMTPAERATAVYRVGVAGAGQRLLVPGSPPATLEPVALWLAAGTTDARQCRNALPQRFILLSCFQARFHRAAAFAEIASAISPAPARRSRAAGGPGPEEPRTSVPSITRPIHHAAILPLRLSTLSR